MTQQNEIPGLTVSTSELLTALEQALRQHFGMSCSITNIERQILSYQSSFAIEELNLKLNDELTLRLIFKNLSWHALSDDARRAKPAFLHDPLREIEIYRTILAPSQLGTAFYYGAVIDDLNERYWLFLEKVPGDELNFFDFVTWQHVARWLAGMHARFAGDQELFLLAQKAHLLTYNGDFYRLWMHRARKFLQQSEQTQTSNIKVGFEWLAERYEQVIERLVALPVTFIHGEFYDSNVLVQKTAEGIRVCPVDWEMAAVGTGLIDLAALIAGSWTEEEKTTMALAYHSVLPPDNNLWLEPKAFFEALNCCRLHVAVQWLGWSQDWSPSPAHAQDWLSEAMNMAERLEL